MPQRTEYAVLSNIKATDVNFDDDYEVDIELNANLLSFEVEGASVAFLATAPLHVGVNASEVRGIVVPIIDAASAQLVNASTALLDDATDIDAVDTVILVDGGNYERFQDLIVPFRVIVGTEQMLITLVVDGATEDTWTAIRGINGTTAAIHLDGAVFTHLVGPETEEFRVDDASAFAVNDIIKIATGGLERMIVTARNETTDIIAVKRGIWRTTPVDIADNAAVWDVIDDVKVIAAVAAANTDLRLLGNANKDGEGDFTDGRIPLLTADFV